MYMSLLFVISKSSVLPDLFVFLVMQLPIIHFRKLSDGLFLRECQKISELYPDIEFNSMIIDNCCMQVKNTLTHTHTHTHMCA